VLEHPHYTRPASYRGWDVPDVLRSGDHGRIHAWRQGQAATRTRLIRPDLHHAVRSAEQGSRRTEGDPT